MGAAWAMVPVQAVRLSGAIPVADSATTGRSARRRAIRPGHGCVLTGVPDTPRAAGEIPRRTGRSCAARRPVGAPERPFDLVFQHLNDTERRLHHATEAPAGHKLARVTRCPRCGNENRADARFCNECGASLAPAGGQREERKVVTIVFADLVGSTARAESLDPEDVRAILSPYHARLRHELERYGGTVEKFIGDAVVGVFGAPVAHEDDAERAVRAALAIQEAIAELNEEDPVLALEVRIGVNTGEALVALDARPEFGEAMVSGDVINTCARVQGAAPPGGVLVGLQTHRATERAIDYADHAALSAKGKAEPVAVWLAVAPRAGFGVEHGDTGKAPLVGRERELMLLTDALARVRSDERPQLVTLVGVPGIGKSRLVHELWQQVDADSDLIVWRRGRSLPYGEGIAYWALGEIVKAQAGILESNDGREAAAKLTRTVAALLPDRGEAAWVERHLRPLVGLPVDEATPAREEAFAARRRFLETLAENGPAVLVFEDLHWADDDLLDFVDELADRLDSVPLLIVCTARPELLSRRPGWGGGKANAATASLEQLSDTDTARLLGALLDRSVLPAETQEAVLRRAGGIPLFAEEYARLIAAGEATAKVPETLQGIVAARIDGLAASEKALLQDASVLGKVFWTDALAALAASSAADLDERLRSLERREFVRRERRSAVEGARQYVFLHALVRDTAYGQIPRAARAGKHRDTAEWIAGLPHDRAEDRAEMLVHHLESAIAYGEVAGLEVADLRPLLATALSDAADRAWALSMAPRAAQLYRRALEAAPADARKSALQLRLGNALWRAEGIGSDGERYLEDAIEGFLAADEREEAAVGMVILGRSRWNAGREERELRERALALVAGAGPTRARCQVLEYAGVRAAIEGRGEEALALAGEALGIARSLGDRGLEVETLNTYGVARATAGDIAEGIESCRAALELALEVGAVDTGRCYVNTASLEGEYGDLGNARRHRREGLAHARRLGHTAYSDWLEAEVVIDDYVAGAWDDAVDRAGELLASLEERGVDHYMAVPVRLVLAAIEVARQGIVRHDHVDKALEVARPATDPQLRLPTLAEAAWVLLAAGEERAVDGLLDEIVTALRGNDAYGYPGAWVPTATLVWTMRRPDPPPDAFVAGNPTRWGEVAQALALGKVVESADLLGAIGARSLEANVRRRAAEVIQVTDPDEARRQLDLAAAFWREVRAEAQLRQLEELRAALRRAAS